MNDFNFLSVILCILGGYKVGSCFMNMDWFNLVVGIVFITLGTLNFYYT